MNGVIIINKQKGCTSHDIVYKIKKIFNEKVGHTGTLDPMAEGVLPILIGKGTLCSKYLVNHNKKYIVNLKLGIKKDTADSEGKTIAEIEVDKNNISEKKINEVFNTFIGKQEQVPPIYSAIKVKGKKLYEYARKGQEVEIKSRTIEIFYIKLIEIDIENLEIQFEVFCGKGTYIRSLCEDIATKLGTIGYMKYLKRIQVEEFLIKDSILIEELEKNKENNNYINEKIISIEQLFKEKNSIKLNDKEIELLLNGVKVEKKIKDDVYKIYSENNEFVGLATVKDMFLKRDIIIK